MVPLVISIVKVFYEGLYELYFSLFVKARLQLTLKRNHYYYNCLVSEQSVFTRKVWQFIRDNDFLGRDNIKINFKLKVIIAAHAVQLSWRLPDEAYNFFQRIIVYPDYYPSKLTSKYHKAEVNPGLRVIVFSMRAIHESLQRKEEGVNVLIHEFAHALWLEQLLMSNNYQVFNSKYFENMQALIELEFNKAQEQRSHFLRAYAFTNQAELFAVAVENFFTRPKIFNAELPELYHALVVLFKQDPFRILHKK